MTERECYERAAKACEALRYLPNGMRLAADEVSTDDCAAAIRALAPSGTTADERDAARYRWIRLADNNGPRTRAMQYHHVEHLDAAIDAALAESALPGQQDGDVSAGDAGKVEARYYPDGSPGLFAVATPSKADELLRELRDAYASPPDFMHDPLSVIKEKQQRISNAWAAVNGYLDAKGSAHGG